ncbi:MAG: hypothetical protein ABSH41_27020 [Syntrophobacteraceae bacterium]
METPVNEKLQPIIRVEIDSAIGVFARRLESEFGADSDQNIDLMPKQKTGDFPGSFGDLPGFRGSSYILYIANPRNPH